MQKDDVIYRQAAIEIVDFECGGELIGTAKIITKRLSELPPAQPERKKGKWMPHSEKSREYIGTVLANVEYDYWFCDVCGYRVKKGQPMYNFCPNCGADMREGEAE